MWMPLHRCHTIKKKPLHQHEMTRVFIICHNWMFSNIQISQCAKAKWIIQMGWIFNHSKKKKSSKIMFNEKIPVFSIKFPIFSYWNIWKKRENRIHRVNVHSKRLLMYQYSSLTNMNYLTFVCGVVRNAKQCKIYTMASCDLLVAKAHERKKQRTKRNRRNLCARSYVRLDE